MTQQNATFPPNFLTNPILLLETIKCEDGKISNLFYHQKRCDRSRKILYKVKDTLALSPLIFPPSKGLYRCRILYGKEIQNIEYIPYHIKEISSLKVVSATIDYPFKYAKRDAFQTLLDQHPEVDEVIIEKDGYLTDTTISNIAFYTGEVWHTPKTPLLKGTMRQQLIDKGLIHEKVIKKSNLSDYTHVALINAMIGFNILSHFNITYEKDPYE